MELFLWTPCIHISISIKSCISSIYTGKTRCILFHMQKRVSSRFLFLNYLLQLLDLLTYFISKLIIFLLVVFLSFKQVCIEIFLYYLLHFRDE